MKEVTSRLLEEQIAAVVVLERGKKNDAMWHVPQSLLWPGATQWRIFYHRMWGQLSTTCSNVLKQPTGELLVAVNHNQLQTMASETVDPIDWSHPPPSWAVPPERLVHSINQCNRSMRGNHLAYAATQGMHRQGCRQTRQRFRICS